MRDWGTCKWVAALGARTLTCMKKQEPLLKGASVHEAVALAGGSPSEK